MSSLFTRVAALLLWTTLAAADSPVTVTSPHFDQLGIASRCRVRLRTLGARVRLGDVVVAFPPEGGAFLRTEFESPVGMQSDLGVFADWRLEMFGTKDTFGRYILLVRELAMDPIDPQAKEKTAEAARLVRLYGAAWFRDWTRFFPNTRADLTLEGPWIREIRIWHITDWQALRLGLLKFLAFYPIVSRFTFDFHQPTAHVFPMYDTNPLSLRAHVSSQELLAGCSQRPNCQGPNCQAPNLYEFLWARAYRLSFP